MPVYKYRSVEDMPAPSQVSAADLEARIRVLWHRAFLLSPPSFPRGVLRFRSIEEANERRARDTAERMKRRANTRLPGT
jgi:hypothetical protein